MNRAIGILVLSGALGACVAPNVVVVDQKTALEQQAAGGYPELENQLEQAGMSPAPRKILTSPMAFWAVRSSVAQYSDPASSRSACPTDVGKRAAAHSAAIYRRKRAAWASQPRKTSA